MNKFNAADFLVNDIRSIYSLNDIQAKRRE